MIATPRDDDDEGPRAERRVHAPEGATEVADLTLSVGRAITVRCTPPLEEDDEVEVSGPPGVSVAIVDPSTLIVAGLLDEDRVNLIVRGAGVGAQAVLSVDAPEVALALVPLATVDVQIDSSPAANLQVDLFPVWPERFPGSATAQGGHADARAWGVVTGGTDGRTDERGNVTLEGVVPGLYEVWIEGERRGDLLTIEPGAQLSRTFVVPAR